MVLFFCASINNIKKGLNSLPIPGISSRKVPDKNPFQAGKATHYHRHTTVHGSRGAVHGARCTYSGCGLKGF